MSGGAGPGAPDPDAPVPGDAPRSVPRTARELLARTYAYDLYDDEFELHGAPVRRFVQQHMGAVAVLALDEADRVLLISQYRHPMGFDMVEIPAGLLDEPGEDPAAAARRELAEEADLVAGELATLVDLTTSPGASNEAIRVYLARDVAPVPAARRHVRTEEEADIRPRWVALDDAVAAVLAGRITSVSAAAGILAAARGRADGWSGLRPEDAPWPTRSHRGAPGR